MKRETAERILEGLAWMEVPFAALDDCISQIEDPEEKQNYAGYVGDLLFPHFRLVQSIVNRFPDLDPDGAGAEQYKRIKELYTPKDK